MNTGVLIVGKAAFMRMAIKEIIRIDGHQVAGEAENDHDAIKKYKDLKPNVAIIDITMPEIHWVDVIIKIKEFDDAAKIIIIAAVGQQTTLIQSIRAGAKDFVVKPLQPDRILSSLQKMTSEELVFA